MPSANAQNTLYDAASHASPQSTNSQKNSKRSNQEAESSPEENGGYYPNRLREFTVRLSTNYCLLALFDKFWKTGSFDGIPTMILQCSTWMPFSREGKTAFEYRTHNVTFLR